MILGQQVVDANDVIRWARGSTDRVPEVRTIEAINTDAEGSTYKVTHYCGYLKHASLVPAEDMVKYAINYLTERLTEVANYER